MLDTGPCKQFFKDASPEECKAMYAWITGAMEVRGLMPIAFGGGRKRRSDAGKPRGDKDEPGEEEKRFVGGESALSLKLFGTEATK